jgi:hypothetical protein
VENFHRQGRALKLTLNFLGKSPCISLGFSDRDQSLKQVRTLGAIKFRPLIECTVDELKVCPLYLVSVHLFRIKVY